MLKGIPNVLSPDLLKVLMEMGHGDEIVIADGNFPGAALARTLIRLDGHGAVEVLNAILQLFPLDTYENPVYLMEKVQCDKVETPIWEEYKRIIAAEDSRGAEAIGQIERFAFYEEAKKAYAIIATGESALYANVMLQKGVI